MKGNDHCRSLGLVGLQTATSCYLLRCSGTLHLATLRRREWPAWYLSFSGLLGVLPKCIQYPLGSSHTSTRLFITCYSINIQARHSATYVDYLYVLVTTKCDTCYRNSYINLSCNYSVEPCSGLLHRNIPQLLSPRGQDYCAFYLNIYLFPKYS